MKKLNILLITVCLCLNIGLIYSSADTADPVIVKYDILNSALSVEAEFGKEYGDVLTTITVSDFGASFNDSSVPPVLKTIFTDKDGNLKVSMVIPSSFVSKNYAVKISNRSGVYNKEFLYAKYSDIESVMLLLNDATTLADVSSIISSNYSKLALDEVAVAPYLSELSNAYYNSCINTDYTDGKIFYKDLMQCLAAAEITCGNDVSNVLKNYKIYIGNQVDNIKTYPESVQNILLGYIGNINYSDGLISEQLPQLRVLAFFKSSITVDEVKMNILGLNLQGEKYIDNFDILSPSLLYYNSVKNLNLVYQNIFLKLPSITNFNQLKTAFESSAETVYKDELKVNVPQSGGGGGSGSSFAGSSSIPTASYNPVTDDKDDTHSNIKFTDITGHWAQNQIEELVAKNVISGYPDGTFVPGKNVTRAEFAKMIVCYAGIDTDSSLGKFTDVNLSDWFYPYIAGAVKNGLINGISDSLFAPGSEITRQDVCVIVYRYLGDKISHNKIALFTDTDMISDYALDAVSALSENSILTGYEDNSFKPQSPITRAETAVILSRVAQYLK